MILVTGGTGYIGSHTVVELMASGKDVLIVDNLCNSKASVLDRIERIAGRRPGFAQLDVRDRIALRKLFSAHRVDAVIHFAGLKAVGESVTRPLAYYDNNVSGSVALFECMVEAEVKTIVFSSSATVYGDSPQMPIREEFPLSASNPYGRTKLMIEEILRDLAKSASGWEVALLRYFNPVGAHASGLIGEDPNGIPNNLMPYIAQVALGTLKELPVYGNDYPTPDGTGVRDYIHVEDLADAHLRALDYLRDGGASTTLNCGYGHGYSVREVLRTVERVHGAPLRIREAPRRAGDPPMLVAHASRVRQVLNWSPRYDDLETIVRTQLEWERRLMREPALQRN